MHSSSATAATTPATPSITTESIPSYHENEREYTPDHLPTKLVQGHYVHGGQQGPTGHGEDLNPLSNPAWTPGSNVFPIASNDIVAHPEAHAYKPHLGYHVQHTQGAKSTITSYSQGLARRDPKPWKNVAITEQDEAEWEEFKERMRVGALGEYRYCSSYGSSWPEHGV